MKLKSIKDSVVEKCPDILLLRKAFSRAKIRRLRALIPAEEVSKAEKDSTQKEKLAQDYGQRYLERFNRDEKTIDLLFSSSPIYQNASDAELARIRVDMHFCRFAYGFMPTEYLTYRLDGRDEAGRRSFISEREHMLYYFKMNDVVSAQVFKDKLRTYERFGQYYRRDVLGLTSDQDFPAFERFVSVHPVFVKKEVYESCGNSVEKIDFAACGRTARELFDDLLSRGKTILEEIVVQSEVTSVFNPSSVNTVRLISFNTRHGIAIPYTFMKIGRTGSFVDNGGAGGILVGIDEKTGVLNTRGIDELHREYEVHPDSGTLFIGHQLPQWEKLLGICRELSSKIPSVGYIGWDFAYTVRDEWVVIEGNGLSQFIGPQSIWQRGIKAEVEEFMRDMKLMA